MAKIYHYCMGELMDPGEFTTSFRPQYGSHAEFVRSVRGMIDYCIDTDDGESLVKYCNCLALMLGGGEFVERELHNYVCARRTFGLLVPNTPRACCQCGKQNVTNQDSRVRACSACETASDWTSIDVE